MLAGSSREGGSVGRKGLARPRTGTREPELVLIIVIIIVTIFEVIKIIMVINGWND